MKKILVILGPTSTGKTDIALSLAKKFNGELVSADSRQVYKGLDIGTGKMPGKEFRVKNEELRGEGFWEIDGIRIWMYDVADPVQRYDVSQYIKEAHKVIEDILERGKLPIVVGGTGLYLKALFVDLNKIQSPVDLNLREELEKLTSSELQQKLSHLAPEVFEGLNNSEGNNKRRLIRIIERQQLSSSDKSEKLRITQNNSEKAVEWGVLKVGLKTEREVLNKKIDERVLNRIEQGMVEEAESLYKKGLSLERMRELGLEYKYLAELIEGKIKSEEFVDVLQSKIHQYAKRQMTWFRNQEKDVLWFDTLSEHFVSEVEKKVSGWYNSTND